MTVGRLSWRFVVMSHCVTRKIGPGLPGAVHAPRAVEIPAGVCSVTVNLGSRRSDSALGSVRTIPQPEEEPQTKTARLVGLVLLSVLVVGLGTAQAGADHSAYAEKAPGAPR